MDCRLIQPELVLYHFGTIDSVTRSRVETHLLSCRECLAGYLALKRQLESETADSGPRPSDAARARLRAAVEREVSAARQPLASWRRATRWSLAAAAAAVLAFVALQSTRPPAIRPAPSSTGDSIPVDSANPGAVGLTVL